MPAAAIRMSISAVRDEIADVANRVAYGHERVLLTRHGRPAVAVIRASDLELLEAIEEHIDLAEARNALAEIGRAHV